MIIDDDDDVASFTALDPLAMLKALLGCLGEGGIMNCPRGKDE